MVISNTLQSNALSVTPAESRERKPDPSLLLSQLCSRVALSRLCIFFCQLFVVRFDVRHSDCCHTEMVSLQLFNDFGALIWAENDVHLLATL